MIDVRVFWIFGVFSGFFFNESVGLRHVRIKIPKVVENGKDAILHCSFDLGGEKLYQLKWYHKAQEFYSFTPSVEEYPIRTYPIPGIHIDELQSKPTRIVLKEVTREISDDFSCEVTAEQSFYTGMDSGRLQVVDIPAREPYITGLRNRYILNETLLANCTSEHSYPAANITWYINGSPHLGPTVTPHVIPAGQYFIATSILRILITPKYLMNGPIMRVRCSATLFNIYNESVEHKVRLLERRRKHKYRNNKDNWNLYQVEVTTAESQLEVPETPDPEEEYEENQDQHSKLPFWMLWNNASLRYHWRQSMLLIGAALFILTTVTR